MAWLQVSIFITLMATHQSQKRLNKEYKSLQQCPTPFIEAKPNEENIFEWHYVITGPPQTPFEHGQYHGILRFPTDYPFKPPSILMITPNGRFQTNTRLCLSISDYHPDTWNPAWSVLTILVGLLSFMTGTESTAGLISTSNSAKKRFAADSKRYNLIDNLQFRKQFPDLLAQNKEDIAAQESDEKLQQKKRESLMRLEQSRQSGIDMSALDPEERARVLALSAPQEQRKKWSRSPYVRYSSPFVFAMIAFAAYLSIKV